MTTVSVPDVKSIVNLILHWLRVLTGIGLTLMLAGAVLSALRLGIPGVHLLPSLDTNSLVYLTGAYWLLGSVKL